MAFSDRFRRPTTNEETWRQDEGIQPYNAAAGDIPPYAAAGYGIDRVPDAMGVNGIPYMSTDGVLPQSGLGAMFDAQITEAAYQQPVGKEQLHKAMETLRRYKAGKANYERRVIENEEWWKLRHWKYFKQEPTTDMTSASAWAVNVVLGKHADAMDAVPESSFLPRAEDDQEEAKKLSSIVPCIMEHCDFENAWSDNWWKKLKSGAGIYGVYWDAAALNGLGDIAIRKVDPLKIYWQPGVTNLQDSRNVFTVELVDNEVLEETYPQLKDKLGGKDIMPAQYLYDDNVDTSDKSVVVDWYYKRGKKLHYCKFVGEQILFSTENDAGMTERGLYDHGKYPFVVDVLFPEEGTPVGFGYIDICKEPQRMIDLMNNSIAANCVAVATPRWLVRGDGGINEEEYADWTKPFVHVQGPLDEQAIKSIQAAPINSNYLGILQNKIAEMKETSGNRDVNNGGAPSGVTAASAIAAMQEQSGKLSRDEIRNSYRCYRDISYLVIELIRQFYTAPRMFRIMGAAGQQEFMSYDNAGLQVVQQISEAGVENIRNPIFDIDVRAARKSAYSKISQNELILQLLQSGLLNPQNAAVNTFVLKQLDFDGKDELIGELQTLGMQMDMFMQFRQMFMMQQGGMMPGMPGMMPGAAPGMPMRNGERPDLSRTDGAAADNPSGNRNVEKAREQTQASTQPR